MRIKKKFKVIFIIIGVIILLLINYSLYKRFIMVDTYKEKENPKNDLEPVYQDHMHEFDIQNSNYIEKFYERYKDYKQKHPEYSDDTIITYVNIGLDNDFYTNMSDVIMEDGILLLCNKYHILKSNYVPDLVSLPSKYGGGQMQKEAASYFMKMVDAAKKDNISLRNVSGYRSYNTQKTLYNNYVKRDGVEKADTYSARAGSSEHQTGLATDINTASSKAHFENTKEYKWLIDNSYKYGFILRYLPDKTFITGYKYEPWHYRYVGESVATYIHEHNLTYEEYYATFILKG